MQSLRNYRLCWRKEESCLPGQRTWLTLHLKRLDKSHYTTKMLLYWAQQQTYAMNNSAMNFIRSKCACRTWTITKLNRNCLVRIRRFLINWSMQHRKGSQTCLTTVWRKCLPRLSSIFQRTNSKKRKLITRELWSSNCLATLRETVLSGEKMYLSQIL